MRYLFEKIASGKPVKIVLMDDDGSRKTHHTTTRSGESAHEAARRKMYEQTEFTARRFEVTRIGTVGGQHFFLAKPQRLVKRVKTADLIPGGKADKKKPSDFDARALSEGLKHELEHTSSHAVAKEIAMDHLAEDPDYYKKLKKVEKTARDTIQNYDPKAPKKPYFTIFMKRSISPRTNETNDSSSTEPVRKEQQS